MKLRERYKRLTIWNKLAAWGSLASIISIPIAFVLFFNQPDVKVEINWNDIESEIQENDEQSITTRTFQLLNEKGASISLGPCPGEKCLNFELGKLYEEDNNLFQTIKITGDQIGTDQIGTDHDFVIYDPKNPKKRGLSLFPYFLFQQMAFPWPVPGRLPDPFSVYIEVPGCYNLTP